MEDTGTHFYVLSAPRLAPTSRTKEGSQDKSLDSHPHTFPDRRLVPLAPLLPLPRETFIERGEDFVQEIHQNCALNDASVKPFSTNPLAVVKISTFRSERSTYVDRKSRGYEYQSSPQHIRGDIRGRLRISIDISRRPWILCRQREKTKSSLPYRSINGVILRMNCINRCMNSFID